MILINLLETACFLANPPPPSIVGVSQYFETREAKVASALIAVVEKDFVEATQTDDDAAMHSLWIVPTPKRESSSLSGKRTDVAPSGDTTAATAAVLSVALCLLLMLAVLVSAAVFYGETYGQNPEALLQHTNGTEPDLVRHGNATSTGQAAKTPRPTSRSPTPTSSSSRSIAANNAIVSDEGFDEPV